MCRWSCELQRGINEAWWRNTFDRSAFPDFPGRVQHRIDQVFKTVLDEIRRNAHKFVWETIPSVEALVRTLQKHMDDFLDDYPEGLEEERYLDAGIPELPFGDQGFGSVLCSHYLFLYNPDLLPSRTGSRSLASFEQAPRAGIYCFNFSHRLRISVRREPEDESKK